MTNKEKNKIEKIISELDTAVGKLLVSSTKDELVKEAMKQVSKVSFDLGNLL